MRRFTPGRPQDFRAQTFSPLDQGPQPEGLGEVDDEVTRRPETESNHSPNVFKLHPLTTRTHHSADSADRTEKEHEVPEVVVAADKPLVSLVSPWDRRVNRKEDRAPRETSFIVPDDAADAGIQSAPGGISVRVPKVIVVDRLGKLSVELGRAVQGVVHEPEILKLDRPTQVVEIAEAEDPDVIVFSPEEATAAGLKRLAQIHKAQPKVVILLSESDKTWSAAQMAASGASDFLPANPSRARLRSKLEAALRTAEQLRVENIVVTERVVIQEAPLVEPNPKAGSPTAGLARVFTIASASGGSGKTVVATNLAAYLVKATAGKVLLIDLDLQFGEVAPSLHLHPKRTIEDLAEDPEDLFEALVDHACGFKTLCAPNDPLAGERISPSQISAILDVARRQFDYVVVDTPPSLNETSLIAFDHSEKLLITANMDVPSLKNMRRFLETIELLDVPAGQSVLVINRVDAGIGIDIKGVSQLFPQGFLAVLPVAKEVPWATNMGVPMLHGEPKAEVSRQLAEGFMKLVPPVAGVSLPWATPARTSQRAGLLSRVKGRI
jgi:pilus assembly protein CpaE